MDVRKKVISTNQFYNAGYDYNTRENYCMEILLLELFYDFHCLMNNEIIFLHFPKYLKDASFKLTECEFKEIDELANLMLNPYENFEKLQQIWKNNEKFRILTGALN